ncbi:MAG: GNAT family N-acetyltransferase [Clostridia bacterium]|nr:GNAT family N-acetyltransferase [Clostridia bacterium]
MILRKARESDLPALFELFRITSDHMTSQGVEHWHWGEYPNEELVRQDVLDGRLWCLYGEQGMILSVTVSTETTPVYSSVNWLFGIRPGVFHRLAVHPALQSQGLGRQAVADVETILISLGCDCLRCDAQVTNARADRFYMSLGMRRAGTAYLEDRDAVYMGYEKRLTEDCPLLPIAMQPAFRGGKLTPWGGDRLRSVYGKEIPEVPTGESLEVSCIPGLESKDSTGVPLTELIRLYGGKLVGRYQFGAFPLLLKIIDAQEPLSVQVHPNDEYAAKHEHGKLGKTEAWLILDAPENAELVYGIQPGTTLDQLKTACEHGADVEPLLRRVKVKRGDVCYIPAGCVHAIGAGIMLYEIQQSSDITYRFYDWNRVDEHGKGRELHLKQALAVTDPEDAPEPIPAPEIPVARVLDKTYFTLDLLRPRRDSSVHIPHIRDFGLLTMLDGELTLCWEQVERTLKKGESLFIPNAAPPMILRGDGQAALSMPR